MHGQFISPGVIRGSSASRSLPPSSRKSCLVPSPCRWSTRSRKVSNEKHRQQWRNTLTNYAAPIFDLAVDDVATEHVLGVLQPIWLSKSETASRVRQRIERVLDAAKVKGLRSGENPARGRGHLELLLPKRSKTEVQHHAALPFAQIADFMVELKGRPAVAARAWSLRY